MLRRTKIIHLLLVLLMLSSTIAWAEGPTVEVSGAVEVELSVINDKKDPDQKDSNDPNTEDQTDSDITLATVELGFDSQITDWFAAHVLLLWEEDDTDPIDMDEGTIIIANEEKSGWSGILGKMYVPFGNFETNLITDPVTLEIGEINESAALVAWERGFYANLYIFNGETAKKDGTKTPYEGDRIDKFGAGLGYLMDNEGFAMDIGVEYLNSIGDTDNMQEVLASPNNLEKLVAGIGVHANFNIGKFMVITEYLGAQDDFDVNELVIDEGDPDNGVPPTLNDKKQSPSGYNVELGFELDSMVLALAYQGTSDAQSLGLYKSSILLGLGWDIADNTALSFELSSNKDYDKDEFGDGQTDTIFVTQLAVEF